jgi:hypothetical protein
MPPLPALRRSLVLAALLSFSIILAAADLEDRTTRAYNAYLEATRDAFVLRAVNDQGKPLTPGVVAAGPGRGNGINDVPGGLVHHWTGAVFLPGITLERALDTSHRFDDYTKIYKGIVASKLVARDGDTYHVSMRLKEGGGGISAVLDVRPTIIYVRTTPHSAYSISTLSEIREVENPGAHDERLLPAGHDSGYLWRADTFTRYSERGGGLFIEVETLGLSRQFPPLLGMFIAPIARRIGRRSVETSLHEFAAAIGPPH